jgi:hypothetical protein
VKLSYALTAAATRGSAGVELLTVGDVAGELVVDVALPEVPGELGVALWPSVALGPGFGELLLHPATATATIAAATSASKREVLRTPSPIRGVTPPFVGVTPDVACLTVAGDVINVKAIRTDRSTLSNTPPLRHHLAYRGTASLAITTLPPGGRSRVRR